uniref:Uncharacterized protein n=1 Tax=Caenorhabditis japonica TaxID=281687 RepID=A0A8R1IDM9_CAEJA
MWKLIFLGVTEVFRFLAALSKSSRYFDSMRSFDKRGGGRAFAGSWSPYLERFYDYKRSAYPYYLSDSYY